MDTLGPDCHSSALKRKIASRTLNSEDAKQDVTENKKQDWNGTENKHYTESV
jgi:hypothetical protein